MDSQPINVFLAMEVLADILGRERGTKITITLTPKEENKVSIPEDGG